MTLKMLSKAVKESEGEGSSDNSGDDKRRLYRIVGENERLLDPSNRYLSDLGPRHGRARFRALRAHDLRTAAHRTHREAAHLHSRRIHVDPAARAGASGADNHAATVFAAYSESGRSSTGASEITSASTTQRRASSSAVTSDALLVSRSAPANPTEPRVTTTGPHTSAR